MPGTDRYQFDNTEPIEFFMQSSSDHRSPVTGGVPTVRLSKNTGAFVVPVGPVTEIGAGWYRFLPDALDYNTVGTLLFHVTMSGADNYDKEYMVIGSPSLSFLGATLDSKAKDVTLGYGGRKPVTYSR